MNTKRYIFLAIIFTSLLLPVSLLAYSGEPTNAKLEKGFQLAVNGTNMMPASADNSILYPITINSRSYLPLVFIAQVKNMKISWDASTMTITAKDSTEGTQPIRHITAPLGDPEEITVILEKDFLISINGKTLKLLNDDGSITCPITYNGNTYIPMKAVSESIGMDVIWDETTQTIFLNDMEKEKNPEQEVPANQEKDTKNSLLSRENLFLISAKIAEIGFIFCLALFPMLMFIRHKKKFFEKLTFLKFLEKPSQFIFRFLRIWHIYVAGLAIIAAITHAVLFFTSNPFSGNLIVYSGLAMAAALLLHIVTGIMKKKNMKSHLHAITALLFVIPFLAHLLLVG